MTLKQTSIYINVTRQGHLLVKLVHSQRAILECNFKSEGRLRSLKHTEHAHIRQSATMARDVVLRRHDITGRALDPHFT